MGPDTDETDRVQSLRLDGVNELFAGIDLPTTTAEVVREFGSVRLDYPGGGSETLRGVLETAGDETYTTVDDLEHAVLTGVQRDAVGRARYSDRDPPVMGEDRNPQWSF